MRNKGKLMAAVDSTEPVRECHDGTETQAWSRVETGLLTLVVALVAAAVIFGPALAHAGN